MKKPIFLESEVVNQYTANSKDRIDRFIELSVGNTNFFKIIGLLLLILLPFSALAYVGDYLTNHFPGKAVDLLSAQFYVEHYKYFLFYATFLIVVAIIISKFVHLAFNNTSELDNKMAEAISAEFKTAEATAILLIRIAWELKKYGLSKFPSDMGLEGDLDFIKDNFYKPLRDKRTNSFFSQLDSQEEMDRTMSLNEWYPKEEGIRDGIYQNLLRIKRCLPCSPYNGDYLIGSSLFSKLAETFLLAASKNKKNFQISLEGLPELIDKYNSSGRPPKAVVWAIITIAPKAWKQIKLIIYILLCLLISIIFLVILPVIATPYLNNILHIEISVESIRIVVAGTMTVFGLLRKISPK